MWTNGIMAAIQHNQRVPSLSSSRMSSMGYPRMIMRAAAVPRVRDWHEAGGEGANAFDLVLGQSRKRTSSVTVKTTTVVLGYSNRKKEIV